MALPALLSLLPGAPAAPSPALSCSALSSVALNVSWPAVPATDLYYVALFADGAADADGAVGAPRPMAIVTTADTGAVVEDLVPSTTYYLRVRSHPSSAPSPVWGWRDWGAAPALSCQTRAAAPLALERRGALQQGAVGLRWRGDAVAWPLTVRWRRIHRGEAASALQRPPPALPLAAEAWEGSAPTAAGSTTATAASLPAGASFAMVIASEHGVALSDPVRFRTAAAGASYEKVYRVAEETHDIDLLLNHNAGDLMGETAFLGDSGNFVLTPEQIAADPCAQALNQTDCRPGKACMSCAGQVWENGTASEVRAQCSNPALPFPTDNKAIENFCGDGFSFFDWQATPITEYCVERLEQDTHAAPAGWGVDGYAGYVSCNAPEAGSLNSHADPVCICACYADRLIAMQPRAALEAHCGGNDPAHPKYNDCNCTASGGVRQRNGSDSLHFVGAMGVRCPYFFSPVPQDYPEGSTACGRWFSFPRGGACADNGLDSDGVGMAERGCSWRRQPAARNLYGTALLRAGWDRSPSFDDKTGRYRNTTLQTLGNAKAFRRAFDELGKLVTPRCCGC